MLAPGILRTSWVRLVVAGLVAGIAGCTTAPTPFKAADGGFGYSSQQIEDDRYRVSFAGNAATPRETVENYLLFRAAEITLDAGHDWFTVVNKDVEAHGAAAVSPRVGVGVGSGVSSNVGVGINLSTFLDGGPSPRYTAYADILVKDGEEPAEDPSAYDARDLIKRLRPSLVLP